MKKIVLSALLLLVGVIFINAQNNVVKSDPVGSWKFEAPYAPEGYTTGTIMIGFAEQKYNASLSFPGNDYKIPAEKVKFENDAVTFSVFVESEEVKVALKIDSALKMSGNATTTQGNIPLTLTRMPSEKK